MGLINSFPGGNGGEDFDFENYQPTFTEASTRANIASGEKNSVILGKLKKWYTDLKAVAFSGNASDITLDSTHRFVTDTEKSTWNAKQNALVAGTNIAISNANVISTTSTYTTRYSTSEQVVGTWIDNSPLYQKTIDFGYLPNNSSKVVNTGISSNKITVRDIRAICDNSSYNLFLPYIDGLTNNKASVSYNKNANQVVINTNLDASSYYAYVTLLYTKA